MQRRQVEVTTTGAAGTSTGSADLQVGGAFRISSIRLDYTSEPATTDVAITDGTDNPIITVSNNSTDKIVYPRLPAQKGDGTNSTLTEVAPVVMDKIHIDVQQGDNNGKVLVQIALEG